jgi:cytohesin
MAELLLAKGADVNGAGRLGDTPLHGAAKRGHKQLVELLVAKGANVDAVEIAGETPLVQAIQERHEDVVAALLNHGANPNGVKRGAKLSPLNWAGVGKPNRNIETLLRSYGAMM